MASEDRIARNWFDQGGQSYARFRPEYPQSLSAYLAAEAPGRKLAVDVGCGTGQLTVQLAAHFKRVVGTDPSSDQIANAVAHDHVRYLNAPAENIPLPDGSADLITAAQAAHWFDLPAFYGEAKRVGRKGSIVALISYGVMRLDGALQRRFDRFYRDEIGPYWPPERRLVDSGYRDLDFPFEELEPPRMSIDRSWRLAELLGYISTWSAVRRIREAGRDDVLSAFVRDFSDLWGDAEQERPVAWPVNMRVGRL